MNVVSLTYVKKKKQMLATKCTVEIKIKIKYMLQQNGRVKQMKGSGQDDMVCKNRENKKSTKKRQQRQRIGAVAVS